jgi:hypothetical protein
MKSNSFKYYGVPSTGKDTIIKAIISYVCFILGNGSNNNADLLISETIKSETQNAEAIDYSKEYGEGLGQFDRGTFDDVIARVSKEKKEKVYKYFLINLDNAKYEDLRHSPMLSVILIRLKYLLIPSAIPIDRKERYEYYKKWYNSINGKATLAHFYSSNGYNNV